MDTQESSSSLRTWVEDLRAYGDSEIRASLASRDRDKHQFWQGWDAALQRLAALLSPVAVKDTHEDVSTRTGDDGLSTSSRTASTTEKD
jgi:hypothetical protein